MRIASDFIVIGSGIAGLSFALKAAERGTVSILVKSDRFEGATLWAQGGIAAVFDKDDSFEAHIQDTLVAGDGLCSPEAVAVTVREGPARVRELIDYGVEFTKKGADYDLTKEGGHHARRILHAEDFTGKAISEALIKAASEHPNIRFFERHVAIDLITDTWLKKRAKPSNAKVAAHLMGNVRKCLGVYALDANAPHEHGHGQIHTFTAPTTVLATGGAGKVYLYTSNPDIATGDGIAMAYRAGARVSNLEFMQFHPTCLFHPDAKSFLISEALRGEGGELVNRNGHAFMRGQHELGSLAPRDIVARAIDAEIKRSGAECVYLDMSSAVKSHGAAAVIARFPNIHEKCLSLGIDLTREPIPVVPAAHYTCGGVATDLNGQTSIEGLYALGETAYTGLHGANRLASNSLLEAVVFADRAVKHVFSKMDDGSLNTGRTHTPEPLPEWDTGRAVPIEERIDIHHTWKEIRTLMWDYVGIVRTKRRLLRAKERLEVIRGEVNEYYWNYLLDRDLIELRNLMQVARLMVRSATLRKESRGLHYNLDYPHHDDQHFSGPTVL